MSVLSFTSGVPVPKSATKLSILERRVHVGVPPEALILWVKIILLRSKVEQSFAVRENSLYSFKSNVPVWFQLLLLKTFADDEQVVPIDE